MFQLNNAQVTLIKIVDAWVNLLKVILKTFKVDASVMVDLNKDDFSKLNNLPGEVNAEHRPHDFKEYRNSKQFERNLAEIKRRRNGQGRTEGNKNG